MYSVVGGIPAYLEQLDPKANLLTNVEQHVLSKGAFLYEEPEFLLRQELREPATYMAILEAIASGASRVTEIANEIDKQANSLSRYLSNLERLAIIEKETPVTDPDGRGVYRLTDQYLRFWFRYVSPNRATLEQGHTTPVRETIADTFPAHVSWTFEDVCRQAVRTPAFPVECSRVGRWWYNNMEVDIAGVNEQTETLLIGECKWSSDNVGMGLLSELERVEPEVRWRGSDRSVSYVLFAKHDFSDKLWALAAERNNLSLWTADDVVSLF
jgi:AAA+ ATPase superfamily predicted ATPase